MFRHFILTTSLLANSCLAADIDIYNLTIEELMSVKVNIATKNEETLTTAPSTTTVLSQKDIKSLGISNAYDVMNFIPGFQMTRGDWVGAVPKEHARGIYLDNGYMLVMINGQRLNESSFGKASVYTPFIPVDIIEKVEIIRGPGSALYGSNAFLGVLNIITHKKTNQVTLAIGDYKSRKVSASWSHDINQDFHLYSNLNVEKSDGENYQSPLARQVADPLKKKYIELGAQYKQNELYFRYSQHQLDQFINLGGYSKENIHNSKSFNSSFKSNLWQNDTQQLVAEISYSAFEIASSGMVLPKDVGITQQDFLVGPYWKTQSSEAKIEHNWQYSAEVSLTSGIDLRHDSQYQAGTVTTHYDYQQQVPLPSDEFYLGAVTKIKNIPDFASLKQSHDIYAGYSQLKWQYNSELAVFLGARYDQVEDIDSKFSPRAALVWQANKNHTIKLQYGESFRPPVNNELYSNDDVTIGNPNLTSEFIKTTEVIWRYQKTKIATEVVLFNNELRDFINKAPLGINTNQFTFENAIDTQMQGLEVNLNYTPTSRLKVTANYSHLFDEPINESFKQFATLELNYKVKSWQLNFNTLWRASVMVENNYTSPFKQPSYLISNANINYQLNDKQNVVLKVSNLFDKHYNVFEPRLFSGEMPGQGRRITLQFSHMF